MAIRTSEELMNSLKERIGDDTSEETLSFVEDMSDTLATLNTVEELRGKYDALKQQYRDRFFNGKPGGDEGGGDDSGEDENPKPLTYENLFKEVK